MTSRPQPSPTELPAVTPMVSHPELVADRPRTTRPPPSVSSRYPHQQLQPSQTRPPPPPVQQQNHAHRRRYSGGRSHHGGSSHKPLNEFPIFSVTGDVEVVIRASNQERKYLLHRLILAQNSGFFEAGTNEDWAAQRDGTERSRVNGTTGSVAGTDLSAVREEDGQGSRVSSGGAPKKNRWRYELDWDNKEDDELPILAQKVRI